jgi:hypothetical protein
MVSPRVCPPSGLKPEPEQQILTRHTAALLANATHKSLDGQWHTVDDHVLAGELIAFFRQ